MQIDILVFLIEISSLDYHIQHEIIDHEILHFYPCAKATNCLPKSFKLL